MDKDIKKMLLKMFYCSSMLLSAIFSIMLIITCFLTATPLYAKILYTIWAGVLLANLALDRISTYMKEFKFICGMLLFVLTLSTFIMAATVYGTMSIGGFIPLGLGKVYMSLMAVSFASNILALASFVIGNIISEHKEDGFISKIKNIKK